MPYAHRNKDGQIICLFANPQPQEDGSSFTDADELTNENPEVVAFLDAQQTRADDPVITQTQLASALQAAGIQQPQIDAAISAVKAVRA